MRSSVVERVTYNDEAEGSIPSAPTRAKVTGAALLVGLGWSTLSSVRFIWGLLLVALGFFMVWKTAWFMDLFGRIPWAEQHMTTSFGAGLGGSWMWYKLLGILVIAAAILYMTGTLQIIVINLLGAFFGAR